MEAGLAIAEMIASLSKPTVSLVLGGSHSIGGPLAVSSDYSVYCAERNYDCTPGTFQRDVYRGDPKLPEYGAYTGSDYQVYFQSFTNY